jgi:hypothetical protein
MYFNVYQYPCGRPFTTGVSFTTAEDARRYRMQPMQGVRLTPIGVARPKSAGVVA